jgi:DNA-binding response OmpR family regulator
MPTALIVEDEPEANKLLSLLVKLRGFQTVSAFTGKEAVEKARDCHPDVVFLDLMLPDVNGYEVCRVLKSTRPTNAVPVVIVTARVAADNRLESFTNGADDYIPKPYTPDQIFESLAQADDWKRDIASPRIGGEIPLDHAGTDTLRRLARLRSLTLARTPLDFATVEEIFAEIHWIWSFVEHWQAGAGLRPALSLRYLLDNHRLAIQLRDHAGWMEAYRSRASKSPQGSPTAMEFVPARSEDSLECLRLIKEFG